MTLTLMEGAVNAVKDYLNTNMATKLDVLDSEYNDGITLTDIKTYYLAEVLAVPEMPSIFVLGNRTEVTAESLTHIKAPHYISVVVIVTDQKTDTLRKRLYRHIRAIVEVIRAGVEAGSIGYAVVFDSFEYSPMYGREGTFLQDAKVECHLTKIETE